jgi:YggT family protein
MNDALNYLITFVLQAACFLFVARFLLQACRVDFYNPISQGIVKITDPVLRPVRLVLPGFRNFDLAALAAAILSQLALLMAITTLQDGYTGAFGAFVGAAILQVLMLCIRIFWWSILIGIIAGWIAPGNYHPALVLLHQITEPLLAPARRILPPMGGLDFSPILVFLILGLLERMLPQIVMSLF